MSSERCSSSSSQRSTRGMRPHGYGYGTEGPEDVDGDDEGPEGALPLRDASASGLSPWVLSGFEPMSGLDPFAAFARNASFRRLRRAAAIMS